MKTEYKTKSGHMMKAMNLWSMLFLAVALSKSGGKTSIKISECIITSEHTYFYATYYIISFHVVVLYYFATLVLKFVDLYIFFIKN
jgi:hypothetical protein